MPHNKIAANYTKNLAASMKQSAETILNDVFSKEYSKFSIERGMAGMDTQTKQMLEEQPLEALYNLWLIAVGEECALDTVYKKLQGNDYLLNIGQYLFEMNLLNMHHDRQTYYLKPFREPFRTPTPCKS